MRSISSRNTSPSRKVCCRRTVGYVRAVDGISFNIKRGTTMGLVGESGCGKTTVGRTILRLTDTTGGEVLFNGREVASSSAERAARPCARRCRSSSRIPIPACRPACPSARSWARRFVQHSIVPKDEFNDYVDKIMSECGLQPYHCDRYPHEFSGGQRQRICIARALALKPEVRRLRRAGFRAGRVHSGADHQPAARICSRSTDLTYLFISHDLSVVEHISDTHRRHVSGQPGGVRLQGGHLPRAAASLHQGAVLRHSGA